MATEVEIAKLALSHIGDRYDLTALTDSTPEAEQINLVFDTVRDMLLREHPWKFAQTFYSPPEWGGGVPAQWAYQFNYPPDALKIIEIVNPLGRDLPPIPFDIASEYNSRVILCDVEEPEFRYTRQVTDTSEFDVYFTEAFAARLAARVVMPLTGDSRMLSLMVELANRIVGAAKSEDANEGVEPSKNRNPDWIRARA